MAKLPRPWLAHKCPGIWHLYKILRLATGAPMFKFDSRTKFARSKLVHRDDAQDFLQRCLPGQRAAQAGLPQPLHALLDGDLLQ